MRIVETQINGIPWTVEPISFPSAVNVQGEPITDFPGCCSAEADAQEKLQETILFDS